MKGFEGFELSYFTTEELTHLSAEKERSSPEIQELYVIAASIHAAAILAVQVWKRSRGVKITAIYPLPEDAVRAYENQPIPMRKRYFPFKVQLNNFGFVIQIERIKNKSLDRNKSGL